MDADDARAIADALKRATISATSTTASKATMRARAMEKMEFDFPELTLEELECVADACKTRARDDQRDVRLTTTFARNCAELVTAVGTNDGEESDEARRRATAARSVFGATYVGLALRVARMSEDDGREILSRFSADKEAELESQEEMVSSNGTNGAKNGSPTVVDYASDGNEDWEPLETERTWYAPQNIAQTDESITTKLRALMQELHPSRVGATISSNKGLSSEWERSKIGNALIDLFETFCASTDEERRALRLCPLRVLRERWAVVSSGEIGIDAGLTRVFAALKFGEEVSNGNEDLLIALELLGYLCLRIGADTMGVSAFSFDVDESSATARAKLWSQVNRAIPVVAKILEQAARSMKTNRDDPSQQEIVGLSALVLTFYATNVSATTANSVGQRIVSSGCLRALVNIFANVYDSSFAEAVRRSLLLLTIACEDVYQFVSRVTSLRDILADSAFTEDATLAGHGALWNFALRENDSESQVASVIQRFADELESDTAVIALRDILLLTHACERAARFGRRRLLVKGGEVMEALKRANSNIIDIITSFARVRDEHLRITRPSDVDDDENVKKNAENPKAPDVEKRREAIVEVSKILKTLLSSSDGVVVRKSD